MKLGIIYLTTEAEGQNPSQRQAGDLKSSLRDLSDREGLITPAMAKAGARELRERLYGEDPEEVVTDVFYAMWAARSDS